MEFKGFRRLSEEEVLEVELNQTFRDYEMSEAGRDIFGNSYGVFKFLDMTFGPPVLSNWYDAFDTDFRTTITNHVSVFVEEVDTEISSDIWRHYLHFATDNSEAIVLIIGGPREFFTIFYLIHDRYYPDEQDAKAVIRSSATEYIESIVANYYPEIEIVESSGKFFLTNVYYLYKEGASRLNDFLNVQKDMYYKSPFADNLINFAPDDLFVVQDIYRAQFFLLMASFEGFLNMIFAIYQKQEYWGNKKKSNSFIKQPIMDKVIGIPGHCLCFQNGDKLTIEEELKKRFGFLTQRRNDFIHANVVAPFLRRQVDERGYRFWHDPKRYENLNFPLAPDDLEKNHIDFAFDVIEGMVESVISQMDPDCRWDFSRAIEKKHIIIEISERERRIIE